MPPRQALVITVDHLTTSQIGAYGRFDAHTPTLNQLAARSFVFHNAFGQAVLPPNQTSAGQQSRYEMPGVDEIRGTGAHVHSLIPPWNPPPREWTHRATDTIRTALASPQPELVWIPLEGIPDPWSPTHPGWEADVARRLGTTWEELLVDEPELTPQQAVEALVSEGHFSRQRRPETPAPEVDQLSVALYQTSVERLDERLGRLIREYQRHAHEGSLLIVAGQSGDTLPRSWPIHRPAQLTSEAVRVPLFIQPGTGCPVGTAVLELVSADDIWPTVFAWISEDRLPLRESQLELLRVARKDHPGREVVRRTNSQGEILVRTPTAQLISQGPVNWLTMKPEDEWDLLNVAEQNPEMVQELERWTRE